MIFNIYYINFPKVYEIKMMLSNIISKAREVTKGEVKESEDELKAKFGFKILDFLALGLKVEEKQKVLTLEKY